MVWESLERGGGVGTNKVAEQGAEEIVGGE